VTGYIAGDALYALNEKHPDYEYSALVRTQEKADIVKKAFPNVRIVLGGNDDSELLKEEAAKADIVLRMLNVNVELHTITKLSYSRSCRCCRCLRPRGRGQSYR
jgi:N-acetyl-gamma-glutamylphosphate reductase